MPPSRWLTVFFWLSASSTPWVVTALSRRAYIAQPPKVATKPRMVTTATRKTAR